MKTCKVCETAKKPKKEINVVSSKEISYIPLPSSIPLWRRIPETLDVQLSNVIRMQIIARHECPPAHPAYSAKRCYAVVVMLSATTGAMYIYCSTKAKAIVRLEEISKAMKGALYA